jgi:pimeloyl-ACP methyl ester carboxylesterase
VKTTVGIVGLCLVAALYFVGASLQGRGTRPAVGTPGRGFSNDLGITYYDGGAGPCVVLLASFARPVSDFNELAETLHREGFRTLAVESRGIGGSDGGGPLASPTRADLASDVDVVLSAAELASRESVHVVGHAFGNQIARTFAARYPERTRSVALIAAGGREPVPPRLTEAILTSSSTFLPWSRREPELRRAFFAAESEIPEHWQTGWWLWGGLAQGEAVRTGQSADFWAGGRAPMLVLQADQDAIAPPATAGEALLAEFPDRVRLVPIRGAGHALLPERPAQIASALVSFLRDVEDQRGATAAGRSSTTTRLSRISPPRQIESAISRPIPDRYSQRWNAPTESRRFPSIASSASPTRMPATEAGLGSKTSSM